MDDTLNEFVDVLNMQQDFTQEVELFKESMRSAYYLFGKEAFRKINTQGARRLAVNKLLMLCLSVLLSFHKFDEIKSRYQAGSWVEPLKTLIETNEDFYRAITYGTNAKWNVETAMTILRDELVNNN